MLLEYVIGFIILLGILIFVHELGHFLVAKAVGVKVLKFSLGFPPAMIKRKWGETEYQLSWIPLGGFVKMFGENPESDEEIPPEEQHRAFTSKPLWARVAVVAAGPLSNYLLAVILLCGAYVAGWPMLPSTELGEIMKDTPAMQAGLREGDKVVAIDGTKIEKWDDMRRIIEAHPGKEVRLSVMRDGKELNVPIVPEAGTTDVLGNPVGRIGVKSSGKMVELPTDRAVVEGLRFSVELTGLVLEALVKVVTGQMSPKNLSGPIAIVQASGESLKAGYYQFVFLLSFISINLAIINLLPVPILDGGHLLFFLIEAIIGRPVEGRVREIATQAGLLFLVFLMVMVIFFDVTRIIEKGWTLQP